MKFYRKILSVIASVGILSGINNATEFCVLSDNSSPILLIDGNINVNHRICHDLEYKDIKKNGLDNDYDFFKDLPEVIPGDTTISWLLEKVENAIDALNIIKSNNELDIFKKKRLMTMILNMLETILQPIDRIQNQPVNSSDECDIILLARSLTNDNFTGFNAALSSLQYRLNDFPNEYLNITVAQVNDIDFLSNLQNNQ